MMAQRLLRSQASRPRSAVAVTAICVGIQRVLAGLLLAAIVAAAARQYGTAAAGTLGVSTTLILIAMMVADFGTTTMSLREFGRQPPSRLEFYQLMTVKVVLAALVSLLTLAVVAVVARKDVLLSTMVALPAVPFAAAGSTASARIIAQGKGFRLALSSVVALAAAALGLGIVLTTSFPPWSLSLALPLARGTEVLVLLSGSTLDESSIQANRFRITAIMKWWPLAAQGALQMLYQRSTILVPALLLSAVDTGLITEGATVYLGLAIVPSVVATAVFPHLAREAHRDRKAALRRFKRYALAEVLLMAPIAVSVLAVPHVALNVMYGSSSSSVEAFLRWSALALLLVGPNSLLIFLLVAFGREHLLAGVWIIMTCTSVGLTAFGAAAWSVPGVGWSVAASEVVTIVCLGTAWLCWGRNSKREPSFVAEDDLP